MYGTLRGIPVSGAIANIRDLGPMMAGILGGPIIGGLTGVIAAIHRYSQGGFTAIPCPIATIFAGVLAGLLSKKFKPGAAYYSRAIFLGVVVELVHMSLILAYCSTTLRSDTPCRTNCDSNGRGKHARRTDLFIYPERAKSLGNE